MLRQLLELSMERSKKGLAMPNVTEVDPCLIKALRTALDALNKKVNDMISLMKVKGEYFVITQLQEESLRKLEKFK